MLFYHIWPSVYRGGNRARHALDAWPCRKLKLEHIDGVARKVKKPERSRRYVHSSSPSALAGPREAVPQPELPLRKPLTIAGESGGPPCVCKIGRGLLG
jgi:hypothetical protein